MKSKEDQSEIIKVFKVSKVTQLEVTRARSNPNLFHQQDSRGQRLSPVWDTCPGSAPPFPNCLCSSLPPGSLQCSRPAQYSESWLTPALSSETAEMPLPSSSSLCSALMVFQHGPVVTVIPYSIMWIFHEYPPHNMETILVFTLHCHLSIQNSDWHVAGLGRSLLNG